MSNSRSHQLVRHSNLCSRDSADSTAEQVQGATDAASKESNKEVAKDSGSGGQDDNAGQDDGGAQDDGGE